MVCMYRGIEILIRSCPPLPREINNLPHIQIKNINDIEESVAGCKIVLHKKVYVLDYFL